MIQLLLVNEEVEKEPVFPDSFPREVWLGNDEEQEVEDGLENELELGVVGEVAFQQGEGFKEPYLLVNPVLGDLLLDAH